MGKLELVFNQTINDMFKRGYVPTLNPVLLETDREIKPENEIQLNKIMRSITDYLSKDFDFRLVDSIDAVSISLNVRTGTLSIDTGQLVYYHLALPYVKNYATAISGKRA